MNTLITGGSRGIGYAVAQRLSASGEHRVLTLGRSEQELAALAESVERQWGKGRLEYLVFDLNRSDPDLLSDALQSLGGLDVLINNAGVLIKQSFDALSEADWRQSFDTNFFAVVRLIRLCQPFFPAGGGHIVNIGSMGGFPGSAKFGAMSAYNTAKAALANLTESLAAEWGDRGPRINCLSLGAAQTDMLDQAFPGYEAPLSAAEMGEFVAWFAVEGQRFFNGKVLPVAVSTP